MPTTAKKALAKKAPGRKGSGATRSAARSDDTRPDAIKLLTSDHREVKAMFQQYQAWSTTTLTPTRSKRSRNRFA